MTSVKTSLDTRVLDQWKKNLAELKRMKVRVGYQPPEGREKYESGITVAKLAAVHEFGSKGDGGEPARSFIRSTIHENGSNIAAVEEREMRKVVMGQQTPVGAMSVIGSYVVGLIRAKLKSATSWAVPLAAETVKRKGGSATVLSDTHRLSQALSWRVSVGRNELARGNT